MVKMIDFGGKDMAMSMNEVISYIGVDRGLGKKVDLKRMHWLMEQLGNPEKSLKFVHIAGTNGKGSTSAYMSSVLREAGYDVGLFVSPHLERVNERIRINQTLITDEEFQKYTARVAEFVDEFEEKVRTEAYFAFEILTAVAFCYFADHQPDIVVLETGVGGRLDATNVIDTPEVSLITSIGIDHVGTLGHTIEEIAGHKGDILKKQGHMVAGPLFENVRSVLEKRAQKVDGSIEFVERSLIEMTHISEDVQSFLYDGFGPVTIQMSGPHQVENACVALLACHYLIEKGWQITSEDIAKGLAKAFWPGRFEKIHEHPTVYIDGAHNVHGVKKLLETLREQFPGKKFTFVIGMMRDKQFDEMIEMSLPLANQYLVTSPDENRGFDAEEVAEWLRETHQVQATSLPEVNDIVHYIHEEAQADELIIQFGSLYLVGALRSAL